MTNKQVVTWNLIAFCVIYFFIEFIASIDSGNTHHNVAMPVMWQYFISWWIIKGQIDKKTKGELVGYTWLVSICVLAARILLGMVFVILMFNAI